jgi:hypothetical protein
MSSFARSWAFVRSASTKTGDRWLYQSTFRKDLPMSFIGRLAFDAQIFSLQRSKEGLPGGCQRHFPVKSSERLDKASIYAWPSIVLPAHGSIQMPYEIFRSAVFS